MRFLSLGHTFALVVGVSVSGCGRDRPSGSGDAGGNLDAGVVADGSTADSRVIAADAGSDGGSTTTDAGPTDAGDMPDAGTDAGPPSPPTATTVRRFGAAGDDRLSAVAVAADGTVFAAGSVSGGSATIGSFVLDPVGPGADIVIFAMRADGAVAWARRLRGAGLLDTGLDPSAALAVGSDGTLWAAGGFEGSADFGDGVTRTATWRNCFVLTLDPATGATVTVRVYGGSAMCDVNDVAPRTGGGFAIGGTFSGMLDLGGGALTPGTIGDGGDGFVAAFDATGGHLWSHGFTNSIVGRTAFDDAGNVYACGGARDDTDVGDGTHDVSGDYAPFVTSFSAAGVHRWAAVWTASAGAAYSIASSADGSVSVIALPSGAAGRLVIEGTTLPSGAMGHVGLSSAGVVRFVDPVPASWAFVSRGASGTVLMTGFTQGAADFGGGPLFYRGGFDVFAASFDVATGAHRWSALFGSTANEIGMAIADDGADGAWVAGQLDGPTSTFAPEAARGMRDLLLFRVER